MAVEARVGGCWARHLAESPALYLNLAGEGHLTVPKHSCALLCTQPRHESQGCSPAVPPCFLLSPKGGFLQGRASAASQWEGEKCYRF